MLWIKQAEIEKTKHPDDNSMSIPIPVARSQLDLYPSRSRRESDVESRRSNVSKRSKSSRKYVSQFRAEQHFWFYNWQSAKKHENQFLPSVRAETNSKRTIDQIINFTVQKTNFRRGFFREFHFCFMSGLSKLN